MSDDGAGKKVGAAGIGLAAILGVFARSADDCGRAGLRAGSVADDVARGAGRVPVAAVADDVALGAGRGRLGAGVADDVVAGAARGKVPIAGLADDGLLALADDAARAGGSHKTLEEALIEAGVDIALELVPLGPDESPSVDLAPPRPGSGRAARPPYMGEPGALALASTPALAAVPGQLRVTIASSTDAADLLQQARSRARVQAPLTILGRADRGREALVIPSSGAPVGLVALLRGCQEQSSPCVVMACDADAPPECDDAIASVWKSAAGALPGVSGAKPSDVLFADPLRVQAQLMRGLHQGRAADPRAAQAFVARLHRGPDGWRLVLAGS